MAETSASAGKDDLLENRAYETLEREFQEVRKGLGIRCCGPCPLLSST